MLHKQSYRVSPIKSVKRIQRHTSYNAIPKVPTKEVFSNAERKDSNHHAKAQIRSEEK